MSTEREKTRTFLHDAIDIISMSTHSLESDDFNRCFQPTSRHEMESSGILYIFSFFIRYFILFPCRLTFLGICLIFYILLISKALFKDCRNEMTFAYIFIIKAINFALGARIKHHGTKHDSERPHIFVSNHTSFVDFILLSNYGRPHACVSENHGGLFYMLFNLILGRNGSIAFKRSERLDRSLVKERMRHHVSSSKLPMLVFPEGTCVNNNYSVMFQKGVFELDIDVCPISIKYKRNLLDPYWNRRKHGFALHIFYLMTRWCIEADVYWLPPIRREENETPVEFGNRAKSLISEKANIQNTLWNGYMKSSPAIKDRELHKVAFINIYRQIRNKEEAEIFTDEYFCFSKIKYDKFLNDVLQEYHRLKNIPLSEQESLISLINIKSYGDIRKNKRCSCKNYKTKKINKKKYKIRNCRLEMYKSNLYKH
ncbi:1-acyl-sn-glycerol-3-phosphate acyltransferase [Vairimorpha necatrix]|uniref:1-acyl-sn-glycerol-3-phosphate acyltransferase n=1 Tax=Vairimorpha necatrix TaxID=6039 RepID=A0AAX4JEB7_9MICR